MKRSNDPCLPNQKVAPPLRSKVGIDIPQFPNPLRLWTIVPSVFWGDCAKGLIEEDFHCFRRRTTSCTVIAILSAAPCRLPLLVSPKEIIAGPSVRLTSTWFGFRSMSSPVLVIPQNPKSNQYAKRWSSFSRACPTKACKTNSGKGGARLGTSFSFQTFSSVHDPRRLPFRWGSDWEWMPPCQKQEHGLHQMPRSVQCTLTPNHLRSFSDEAAICLFKVAEIEKLVECQIIAFFRSRLHCQWPKTPQLLPLINAFLPCPGPRLRPSF